MRMAYASGSALLLAAASSHAAVMQWTFDSNNQQWAPSFGATDGAATTWVSSGGNPGGYVHSSDAFDSAVWYFGINPTPSIGDVSAALGGTLTFDLKATGDTSTLISGFDANTYDVGMSGGGTTLRADLPIAPTGTWTTFSINLSAASWWKVGSGGVLVPATNTDLQQVLSNLTDLTIRGGYYTGHDATGLDNVTLNAPVPETASLAAISLGASALLIRRKR